MSGANASACAAGGAPPPPPPPGGPLHTRPKSPASVMAGAVKGIEGALQQIVGQLDLVAKAVANMEDRLGKNEQDIGAMMALLNEAWAAS